MIGILVSACLLSGCVLFVLGAGAAGGLAATHDKVHLQFDTDFENGWKITHKALDFMGIINSQDKAAGTILATIEESNVVAKVTVIGQSSIQIEVKARKNMLPNLDLANKILNDINNRLHALSKTAV